MGPLKSPNGHRPVRVTCVNGARDPGVMARVASWLVNVATPKLMPERRTAPLRKRARNADARLERTARRLIRGPAKRGPTDHDGRTR
jgi:hypothetical protein